ncbi:MAG: cryptochrome/photolyase family protein [Acidimicrobiia bacterium]|nr:cryptochrome/photolyase family protein [Acidimicrobiia bacterium]
MATIWVLGDQLNRHVGALAAAEPSEDRVLLVESERMLARGFHRQRTHLVLAAMRRFAAELAAEGFSVDLRRAPSLAEGLAAHVAEHAPDAIVATEPNGREVRQRIAALGVELVESDQFLCTRSQFEAWADGRERLRMEDFYRWQRTRLGYLMDGEAPAGGRWNFDHDNREPPPAAGGGWPTPVRHDIDPLDREVLEGLEGPGADPVGWWPTSRRAALAQLDHFVEAVLPLFGPHEDAMLSGDWHLAHSLLSPALNLGLILPEEVCDAVEQAYRDGRVPINSAEGFIRQVIGWREFVRGVYWLWPDQWDANGFDARLPIPPAWVGEAETSMACLGAALEGIEERGWLQHIQRLMVLANLATLLGLDPRATRDWMRERFVDAANWVMGPNVMGMGMFADGGRMSTKPYVSGGAYVNRMSDYCSGCRFDPKRRVGDDACPFTTLYWDFLDRHRAELAGNHRMARQYATLDRLTDLPEVRRRAAEVVAAMGSGAL